MFQWSICWGSLIDEQQTPKLKRISSHVLCSLLKIRSVGSHSASCRWNSNKPFASGHVFPISMYILLPCILKHAIYGRYRYIIYIWIYYPHGYHRISYTFHRYPNPWRVSMELCSAGVVGLNHWGGGSVFHGHPSCGWNRVAGGGDSVIRTVVSPHFFEKFNGSLVFKDSG